jgi:tetratricopeptide (TPR) repeat protein
MNLGYSLIKSGKPNDALNYLLPAYAISKDIGVKQEIKTSSYLLAQVYELKGDFKQAYKYLHETYLVNDSLTSESINKQIIELQTQYETEKKEKTISLLNKENQLIEAEKKQKEEALQKQKVILTSTLGHPKS